MSENSEKEVAQAEKALAQAIGHTEEIMVEEAETEAAEKTEKAS